MIRAVTLSIALAVSGVVISHAVTSNSVLPAVREDVASIRAARTDLNAALVSRDLAAISKYWLQEAQSVFAGGEVKVGRPDILARYAAIHIDRYMERTRRSHPYLHTRVSAASPRVRGGASVGA